MGTRGLLGFHLNGVLYGQYNQMDMYPDWAGDLNCKEIAAQSLLDPLMTDWRTKVASLRIIHDETPLTIGMDPKWHAAGVSTGKDWYSLLRNTQGSLASILDAGAILNAGAFYKESLFCEWGYILDFDRTTTTTTKVKGSLRRQVATVDAPPVLEVYRGFQTAPHKAGRFAHTSPKPKGWKPSYEGERYYYPIKLVAEIPVTTMYTAGWTLELELRHAPAMAAYYAERDGVDVSA